MTFAVLNVAFPFAPVGPGCVGGAEQVLSMIDRGLVEAGHRSLVIACEGSEVAGELIATPLARGMITNERRTEAWRTHRHLISDVVRRERVDVIHLHGIDFSEYLPEAGVPTLVTLHLPPDWYVDEVFSLGRPDTHLLCVSEFQRRNCPRGAVILDTIENGVAIGPFERPGEYRKKRFAAALARICPEKNLHVAMDAAAMANMPLLLAGEIFPYQAHQEYFDRLVRPRLSSHARFIGPVAGSSKRRLLRLARCVLIPSTAQETSSLVAMESLAAGTPVIAFPSGCLPDIVEHGRTGYIVKDVAEMASAIDQVDQIESARCHHVARERFDGARMVRQYLECYSQQVGSRSTRLILGEAAPASRTEEGAIQRGTTLLQTTRELCVLRDQWARLWMHDSKASVFQSPHWLLPWARWFAGDTLRTAAQWGERGSLKALAPVYLRRGSREASASVASSPTLLPLGIGTSDYLDILIADEPGQDRRDLATTLMGSLSQQREWKVLDFPQLRAGAHVLQAAAPENYEAHVTESAPCSRLTLPESLEQLWSSLPRQMTHNLRYYEQRARRVGTFAYSRADSRSLEEHVETLFRLHTGRWAARGEAGVLSDPAVQGWHREVIEELEAAGLLRMYGLRLEGQLVAVHYGMADPRDHGGAMYFYLGGFDPEFSSISPGTLLIGHAVSEAVHEGASRFDFLRGREAYKRLWGAQETPTYCLRFEHAAHVAYDADEQKRNAA